LTSEGRVSKFFKKWLKNRVTRLGNCLYWDVFLITEVDHIFGLIFPRGGL
jgi:hypothetical protein